MSPPRILDEAAEELAAAVAFVEAERLGRGGAFLRAYGQKLRQLVRFPESGALVASVRSRYRLRSFLLRRYRYMIIAGVIDGRLTIVAVAHTARSPGYWRDRVG